MGRSHALSGGAVWLSGCAVVSLAVRAPLPVVVAGTVACALGALSPDVDHPDSTVAHGPQILARKVAKLLRPGAVRDLLYAAGWLLALPTRGLAVLVHRLCGHRGPTHSVLVAVALTPVWVGLAWLPAGGRCWWLGLAFGVGWLAHIAGDWCTVSGVPLWWPLSARQWRSPRPFLTGGGQPGRLLVAHHAPPSWWVRHGELVVVWALRGLALSAVVLFLV